MRMPQPPPSTKEAYSAASPEEMLEVVLGRRADLIEFVRRVNDRYLHWDKLRFQQLPLGISPQLLWAAVYFSRRMQRRELPISFTRDRKLFFVHPPSHEEWLNSIDKQGGGNIGTRLDDVADSDSDRYLYNSLMEEAIASSQLEGASTTRRVAKEMLRSGRKPRNDAERMILNNYRTILEVRDLQKERLTPEMLCHLQRLLTENTLENPQTAGRFRLPDESVVVEDRTTGEVLHNPPPASEIDWRIQEICDFANTISKPFVHPVIKAAILHFAIGFVHPFVDGNGRTARAIFYWYMLKRNYWLFEYLPISRVFVKSPAKYARAYLYTETDSGDVTYFIRYNLQSITVALADLQHYLVSEQRELKEASKLLESFPGLNYRQRSLINDALKTPAIRLTTRIHQGKYQVTNPTAMADLVGLVHAGLLERRKEGRTWYFSPVKNLRKQLRLPKRAESIETQKVPEAIARSKLKAHGHGQSDGEDRTLFD